MGCTSGCVCRCQLGVGEGKEALNQTDLVLVLAIFIVWLFGLGNIHSFWKLKFSSSLNANDKMVTVYCYEGKREEGRDMSQEAPYG